MLDDIWDKVVMVCLKLFVWFNTLQGVLSAIVIIVVLAYVADKWFGRYKGRHLDNRSG